MIDYKVNESISVKQFIELLNKTTLGVRRPLEDENVSRQCCTMRIY